MKNSIFSLAILIGTIIGAGVFGLPYVISRSGVLPGILYFLILGGAAVLIHLFLGEVCLRTNGKQRVVHYAQRYLGKKGKFIMAASVIVGLVGSLLAYGIIAGDFLKIIFSSQPGLSSFSLTIAFMVVFSFFIIRGVKIIAPIEIFTNIIFFAIIGAILYFGLPLINFNNFSLINNEGIFLPFGVIMFSLIGWSAIPEIVDVLQGPKERKNLKKIIIFGTTFCILLYVVFSLVVFGISGRVTSEEALGGLMPFLGERAIFFGALAAVITLADSFLIVGLSLKNTFLYDFKLSKPVASFIACGLPLILFIIGFREFISTICFIGTIVGLIAGVAIIFMFLRAKKNPDRMPEYNLNIPPFIAYLLIIIFALGAFFQFYGI